MERKGGREIITFLFKHSLCNTDFKFLKKDLIGEYISFVSAL